MTLEAAVDVGTTTLAAVLVDAGSGLEIARAQAPNPQCAWGHDVLSRVSRATGGELDEIQAAAAGEVDRLLSELAGGDPIERIAVVGNTAMLHLLLGVDPSPLATAPYRAVFLEGQELGGSELGLAHAAAARVFTLPCVSAYVGADVTAGLLASGVSDRGGAVLYLDVGTNGEVVLKGPGGMLACSTAAGPAFEGMGIERGMRAEDGAVERVAVVEGRIVWDTIGDASPGGLSGSGLLSLLGLLVSHGVLDGTGRFADAGEGPLAGRVTRVGPVRRFVVSEEADLFVTQKDVRQLQLAKAAVQAGIGILLDAAGLAAGAVDEVVIAGAFGRRLDPDSLVSTGLVPAVWRDRIESVGNAAIAGAVLALDPAARARADDLAASVETLDLATHPEFQDRFVEAMSFPSAGT